MKNGLLIFLFLLLSFGGYSQTCTLSVSISSTGTAICSGNSVILTATPSAGTAPYTYVWSTGETTPSISVNKAATYSVTVSDNTPGCPAVKQSITITSANIPNAPTVNSPITVCQNSSATLTATAPGGFYQWYDSLTGGNFLGSGASFTTPPITAFTIFYVETTIAGCTSQRTPVVVNIQSQPLVQGANICQGNIATVSASGANSYVWYDAPGGNVLSTTPTYTTPVLFSNTTYYVVATFANGCVGVPTSVAVNVSPPPQTPTVANVAVCSGSVASLHASVPVGTIEWYSVPNGGVPLISSPDYATPPLAVTTTYYVQTVAANGCVSPRIPVTATVNPIPPTPTIANVAVCSGSSATLTPTGPGGPYQWYDAQNGGTLLATGNSFNTPALTNTTTYYVNSISGSGCPSARVPVIVTVNQLPDAPSVNPQIVCSGNVATLTPFAPGGIYQWYDAAIGGNLLATNASYTTPALIANTTYYVQTTVTGCTSARSAVMVTVLPVPATPTASGPPSVCLGSAATLTASGGVSGTTYDWYDASTGGNYLSSGQVYVTPALLATATFYVQSTNGGCPSARTPITVIVDPTPSPPTTSSGPAVCPGTGATLTANAASGTIQWYAAANGGVPLASGNTYTTGALFTNTIYYAENDVGSCPSTRTAVTAMVINVANPQFQYPSGTFCTSGSNPTPTINNPSGGTFSASPVGLVFISITTGQINVAASTPGNYTVSFLSNGTCAGTTSAAVAIVTIPNAQFSYSGPFCTDLTNPLPVFPAGASGGVFTASPGGLVFKNTSTGEINLAASTAGTYTVTNTIAASGACSLSVFSTTVTIDPVVLINAGPDQTIPSGSTAQLAGSVTNAPGETWSGGTGSFSNPHIPNPVYTPGPGETSATLTFRSSDPPGPCGAHSDQMVITINPVPGSPTASGLTICSGSTATLSATSPGGAYQWYDALTGGTLLQSGPSYTTPPLITNTTYYVQTTIGGIVSSRTPVTVTVNAIPALPVVSAVPPICSGSTATLTASGSSGNFVWYDSPVGGSQLSTASSFVTPALTTNTSYYVEASANTCTSSRTKVDVTVNPIPNITSSPSGATCSGNAFNYTITSNIPTTTFAWSRAAVAGISNPAIANQASANINETLINTGGVPVNVTYIIVPTASGCPGAPFNYIVTVNPTPVVTSGPAVTVCNATSSNYTITFNTPASFTWSRAVVAGISNTAVSGQTAGTIQEALNNTTNAPVNVTYVFNYAAGPCAGVPYNLVVTVNPTATVTSLPTGTICGGVAQNYTITSNMPTATFSWSRATVAGISNPAVTNQTLGTIAETLNNTSAIAVKVPYIITPSVNGCAGTPFTYTVTVSPQPPIPVANANSPICIGSTIQLRTPTIANATYLWTGPNGYSSTSQNNDITNVTLANSGVYNLVISVNGGCASNPSPVTVTVDEPPLAVAGPPQTVCNNVTSVTLAGTISGGTNTGIWSGGTGKFLPAPDQLKAQYIPTAADKAAGSVTLTLISTSKDDCTISSSPVTITFLTPTVTSSPTNTICTGNAQNYVITSAIPTATFSWSRAAVPGISNPAVTGQTTGTINETLINTGITAIDVTYVIVAIDNGCPGTPFNYVVTVNPTPVTPSASVANTHVCLNSDIQLQTPVIANATYAWTGPNSFTSANQNPDIPNVTAAYTGTYSLVVSINGCPSLPATVSVVVDVPPVAVAGGNQIVCATTTSITVAGTVDNGAGTGMWTTNGTGKFTDPTQLNTQYLPSAADIAAGTVQLFLTPTSKPDCVLPAPSGLTISFLPAPAADAGPDQDVCSQATTVILAGKIMVAGGGNWTTSGSGNFSPANAPVSSVYLPSADDIKNGSVTLTLHADGASECAIATSDVVIKFTPPPTVNAGGTKYLLKGKTLILDPAVSDNNVQYLWTPNTSIDNNTIKDPTITGVADITYTLTVTDSRGCIASDQVIIKVLPALTIPNAFTPNGDGVNDLWDIKGLDEYQQSTVDIFDRYGQKVFHSVGYGKAWDGTYGGKQVPVGTYYYIIDTKIFGQILSGPITLIR